MSSTPSVASASFSVEKNPQRNLSELAALKFVAESPISMSPRHRFLHVVSVLTEALEQRKAVLSNGHNFTDLHNFDLNRAAVRQSKDSRAVENSVLLVDAGKHMQELLPVLELIESNPHALEAIGITPIITSEAKLTTLLQNVISLCRHKKLVNFATAFANLRDVLNENIGKILEAAELDNSLSTSSTWGIAYPGFKERFVGKASYTEEITELAREE